MEGDGSPLVMWDWEGDPVVWPLFIETLTLSSDSEP